MHSAAERRVLVTGGAGFIGSHVVEALLERGCNVLVYDNLSTGRKEFLPMQNSELSLVEGDIRDATRIADAIQNYMPTHCIHMAAIHFIPYCNQHPNEAIDVNITGTERVFRALEAHATSAFERLVFASSAAVYPPSDDPHQEEDMPAPTDVYGLTKYTNEIQGHIYHRNTSVPTVAARIFNAYGPRETNPHLIPEILLQLSAANLPIQLGNTTTKRSFVFVQDAARGLVELLLNPEIDGYSVFNIGSHAEYSAEEIISLLAKATGKDIPWISTADRKRKSDRMRLQPALRKIESLGWREEYDIGRGLERILLSEK